MALDLDTTYRAILQAARKRTFITYGEIAAAHGVPSTAAQALLPAQLETLMRICHAEGWPFAPAIVFHEPALGHAGSAAYRDRLVAIVRSFGIFVSDATAFIRTEQDRVFDWAPGAPDHLPAGSAVVPAPEEAAPEAAEGGADAVAAARRPLDLDTTYRAIVQSARRRAFITYGEIAAANGVVWNTVRSGVPAQLYELMQVCRRAGWPFLPVIVVNARGREEGALTPESRDKLVRVARELGVRVEDPDAFVRAEQERVFDWAPRAPEHLPDGTAGAGGAAAEPRRRRRRSRRALMTDRRLPMLPSSCAIWGQFWKRCARSEVSQGLPTLSDGWAEVACCPPSNWTIGPRPATLPLPIGFAGRASFLIGPGIWSRPDAGSGHLRKRDATRA